MDVAMDFVKAVASRHPVFYANGNHEYRLRIYPEIYGDMYEQFLDTILNAGVIHLVNESAYTKFKNLPVAIHGFEADRGYYHRFIKILICIGVPTSRFPDIVMAV